jgi:hypothetical protein
MTLFSDASADSSRSTNGLREGLCALQSPIFSQASGALFVLDLVVHLSWREKILDRFELFVGQPKSRLKLA